MINLPYKRWLKRVDGGEKISPSFRNEHFSLLSVVLFFRTNCGVAHQSSPWPVASRIGPRGDLHSTWIIGSLVTLKFFV